MKTDALVITCIDARLHRAEHPYLADYLRGKRVQIQIWDLATAPGGCRDLAVPETEGLRVSLLRSVKIAHDAHGVSRVILVNHSDCGAYGGAAAFPNAVAEYKQHAADLRAARDVVRAFQSNLDVRLLFATIEDHGPAGPVVTLDEVR